MRRKPVSRAREAALFELADLIVAVGRQINSVKEVAGPAWPPVEITVMRYLDRHPGSSPSGAAEALGMARSNFSRALRGLEARGVVRRDVDPDDARRVRLHPTEVAADNLVALRRAWSRLIDGSVADHEVPALLDALHRIETTISGREPV